MASNRQPRFEYKRLGFSKKKMADDQMLLKIMSNFPSGISLAFAYGSGVFQQEGNASSKNMLDFVFVLENARRWHEENLRIHRKHYSFVGCFGPNAVISLQDNYGAGMYYNTLVPMGERIIKYGTITRNNFLLDLKDWQWMYISGRLHKPVKILRQVNDNDISLALKENLKGAFNAALLSLPEEFTEQQLFMSIAGLSFAGDFRMIIGENKNKVRSIVGSNIEHFRHLYQPILLSSRQLHFCSSSGKYQQSHDRSLIFSRMMSLPKNLQRKMLQSLGGGKTKQSCLEETFSEVSKDGAKCSKLVKNGLQSIVGRSSVTQSIKGIATAGGYRTLLYSTQKMTKMLRGMFV